jgi:peptide/nickel transport system substrate-binding protein
MVRRLSLFFMVLLLALTGCSMQVSKDNGKPTEAPKPTADLSKESKVRPIELLVTTADYDPVRYEFGLMIAEEWKKLGFDVKVTPLAWNRLAEVGMKEKDYDAFTLAWAGRADRIDPDHFVFSTLHSSQSGKGSYNLVGYNNPEYDKLAEEQRKVTDVQKRKELVFKAQEMYMQDLPYAPVVHRNQLMAYNKKDFTNMSYMMGEGLNSFWTFLDVTPTGDKKIIRWAYPSDIDSLNPLSSTNAHDFQVTRLMYDHLTQIAANGEPKNWAAESIEDVNKDGKTYKVKLRSGMKFHDGKPVRAEDVKFSFDIVKDVKSPYFLGMVTPIESVQVLDDLTVQFNLKEPFAPFISNTLAQMYILPEHIWKPIFEKGGAKAVLEFKNDKIIGSGPFKLEYWRKDEEMKMVRNDDYFQKPHIEGILSIPYANVQGMVAAVQEGVADFTGWWVEPNQAEKMKANANLEVIEVKDFGLYHVNYNMRRMPFDDRAVRLALSYVIPKKKIVDQILEGHGEPANSIIAPANEFWHDPNIKGFDYDPAKAKKVLEDAGYKWDKDGKIYYPNGKSDQGKDKGILRPVQ